MELHAYLGIDERGEFRLYVSRGELSPIGTRLETPKRVFPKVIREQAGAREDPALAIEALRAAKGFFAGTQAGASPPASESPLRAPKHESPTLHVN